MNRAYCMPMSLFFDANSVNFKKIIYEFSMDLLRLLIVYCDSGRRQLHEGYRALGHLAFCEV
jgi:hypothetical protein